MIRKARAIANGFTLLEVIIAGLLLSIVGAGTLSAFSASHQLLLSAQYRLEAMNAARQDAEILEASAFDDLDATAAGLPAHSGMDRVITLTPALATAIATGVNRTVTIQITRRN